MESEKGIDPDRNYNTITPSAKMLILLKGYTNIPYARQVAEWIMAPEPYVPDFSRRDLGFWARVIHFENRYWSINRLIEDLDITNILELSSGFSMRGLDAVEKRDVHYIDTDLQEMIDTKKEVLKVLHVPRAIRGKLELLPLNAIDEEQFRSVLARFPPGKLAIVNEGLLIYLDKQEKEKLCRIIRSVLKERGGCWITADIYTREQPKNMKIDVDPKLQAFLEAHRIEENKFENQVEAERFFRSAGFRVEKKGKVHRSDLSSLKYFIKSMPFKLFFKMRKAGRTQATWQLVPEGD